MTGPVAADMVCIEREGPLGIVTLNRPERLNALNAILRDALAAAMGSLIDDETVRAILLTGTGRAFCAGSDLQELAQTRSGPSPGRGGDLLRDLYNPLIQRMLSARKPIVAALNGPAIGVGCSLALAADIVVAAQSASLSFAFARLGAMPDAGLTWILPKRVGESRALALLLLAEDICAEKAKAWGLIHDVFSDDDLPAAARALALQLAHGPTRTYAGIKALTHAGAADLSAQLELEAQWQDDAFATADSDRGIAAFLTRERPEFEGR